MKILIIDDNPAVRATLKLVLADEFDQIAAVGDPRLIPAILAPGKYRRSAFRHELRNTKLDGSDGLFWLSRIKEGPDAPAVVLITAFGDVPLAVEAMKRGAEDFVTKPWDNDDLIAKIHKAIATNRAARAAGHTLAQARDLERQESLRRAKTLDEIKIEHASAIVDSCGGNLTEAAERLGVTRQTLYNILKKK